nr:hypothetical protein [Agromyces sp. ISL-38]
MHEEPRAVRVQVADRHMLGDPWVGEGEFRQVQCDRSVPVDDALGHLVRDDGRTDRLRHRRELEHGVGVDGLSAVDVAHTESL